MKLFAILAVLFFQVSGHAWEYSIRHKNCNLEIRLSRESDEEQFVKILESKNYNVIQSDAYFPQRGNLFLKFLPKSSFNPIPIPGLYGEHTYYELTIFEAGNDTYQPTEVAKIQHSLDHSRDHENDVLNATKKLPVCKLTR